MSFFNKVYLSIIAVMTVALCAMSYAYISRNFNSELDVMKDAAWVSHENNIHEITQWVNNYSQNHSLHYVTYSTIEKAYKAAKEEINTDFEIANYSSIDIHGKDDESMIVKEGDKYIIKTVSRVYIVSKTIYVSSKYDITEVYLKVKSEERNMLIVFLVAYLLSALVAFILSRIIVKPVKALEEAGEKFSKGEIDARVKTDSNDEVGKISRNYNIMADSIQEKIASLELSVKQKEDFQAAFAHELKSPMTSIIGYTEMLQNRNIEDSEIREAIDYIHNESLRLESLSHKMMDLISADKSRLVFEDELTLEFFEDVKIQSNELSKKYNVASEFDIQKGFIKIEIDLFKTLVMNLIDNGMKSGATKVKVSGIRDNDKYVIIVEDNGRGIPEEELSRVTEAFYMVDKSRSRKENGVGLGLSLVDSIAKLHGADLKIESKVNEGTKISVTLELLEDDYEEEC